MAAASPVQPASQSLEELALQIASLAHQCSTLLKASQNAPLTTKSDSPAASAALASLPSDLRNQLAEAALDLWSVAIGPEERIRRLAIDWSIPSALRYIVHFGIPDLVPQTGEISYTELAVLAKVPEAHLKRIIRLAGTAGIFTEVKAGFVAHTVLSVRLSSAYPELSNYAAHCLEFSFPVAARMPEMSELWNGSEEKTHTAFNVAYNTEEPLFKWLQHEPADAVRFGKLMGAMRKNPSWDVKHLVEGWKGWEQLEKGSKVVDVGGSLGHASTALAVRYDGLDFVVQDLGYVVAQAKETKSVPEVLDARVKLMAHDFFTEQPVKDADVYLLRQILHDWADESAVKILKSLVPALQKKGARILIMDQVVPAPGSLGRSQEREARTVDLVVMSHFNGKQRDLDEWEAVLQSADQRLKISQVVQPTGSHFAIIEVFMEQPDEVIQPDVVNAGSSEEQRLSSSGDEPLLISHDLELKESVQNVQQIPQENEAYFGNETAHLDEPKTNVVEVVPDAAIQVGTNGPPVALDTPVAATEASDGILHPSPARTSVHVDADTNAPAMENMLVDQNQTKAEQSDETNSYTDNIAANSHTMTIGMMETGQAALVI